jgi:L-2-hydroxyglutarate oxidase LhgO
VLAAGLSATALGRLIAYPGAYRVPETYPARGHYYSFSGRAPFRHLVYPMPQGAWLGVHLTLDTGGRARFGPDLEWTDTVSYAFDDKGGERRTRFEREIRRYWPGLPEGALAPDFVGVRPKIYREGESPADFAIHGPAEHGRPRLVALYGIESPGLTSSLGIGAHVAALIA